MCKIYGRYLFFEYRPSFFVDILKISAIIEQYPNYPGVAQLVARLTGGQEAASSSLVTRTIRIYRGFAINPFFMPFFDDKD